MNPLSKLVIFGLLVTSGLAAETEDAPAADKANNEARVLVGKHVSKPQLF